MILEHAQLVVTPGREAQFEATMREALVIIESAPDCHGADVRRQVEDGSKYLLLVRWTSLEAHLTFRATALFERWRALTHPFYASTPVVTHFHEPIER